MKKFGIQIGFFIALINLYSFCFGDLVNDIGQKLRPSSDQFFVNVVEEKKKLLADLQKEKKEFAQLQQEFEQKIKTQLEINAIDRVAIEKELKGDLEDDFLTRKMALLNETYQILKDVQRVRERLVELIDSFIKLLNDFIQDPDLEEYKKEQRLVDAGYYTFDDLLKLQEKILAQEKRIAQLHDQDKTSRTELESRKRTATNNRDLFVKKEQELQSVLKQANDVDTQDNLESDQVKKLLAVEEQLFEYRKELDDLRIREVDLKILYINMQILIANRQLAIFKNYRDKVKPSIRVSEADVKDAKDELAKIQQSYYGVKEAYRKEMDILQEQDKKFERELANLSEKDGITLGREIDEWSKDPKQTVDAHSALYAVGSLNSHHLLINKQQELLDAQNAFEDEKYEYQKLLVQVKDSYHKISTRKFLIDDEITQEVEKYDAPKVDTRANLARYREKISQIADFLNLQKKIQGNINLRREDLQKQKNTLFKGKEQAYTRCLDSLNRAEEYVKEQVDILTKMSGVYSGIIAEINDQIQLIDIIRSELSKGSTWYRPAYAITLQGVQNILLDATRFLSDVRSYISRFEFGLFFTRIKDSFKRPMDFIILLVKILVLFVCLLVVRFYAFKIQNFLLYVSEEYKGFARFISMLFVMILEFYRTYFVSFAIWMSLLCVLWVHIFPDPFVYILFYLFSIPYLLYLSQRFIKLLIQFNVRHEHVFLGSDFQKRFFIVFSTLVYATTIIFFFREAFMLVNYYESELPNILLAANFIVFQISLIFLIAKEQILNLIPQRSETWIWIRQQVDRYYYLILLTVIAVIVMSNPYVGFGRLVLHIMTGVIYTAFLMVAMLWLHGLFKKIISRVFFSSEDEVVRERFINAKTWFGLLIIASVIVIGFLGFITIANIWGPFIRPGWYVNLTDVFDLLKFPLLQKETKNPITILSILQIIAFVLAGFLISYGLNKLVLDKIFDLLLVDAGVQNTVTRITRYVVVVIAIFIGFNNVGLGQLVAYVVGGLVLGLGWILKDPVGDFIAYFIILVQRPLKIGDYIKISDDVMGVVRKITPRSLVLRRKNSTTLVVPNSYVINNTVTNWNYARNFIAFNDISVTVNYKENPQKVKDLLEKVVTSHPNVLRNPKPIIRLENFSEHGFVFMVRGFLSSAYTLEMWGIASDIRFSIVAALQKEKIELAVPMRLIVTNSKFEQNGTQIEQLQEPPLDE